MNLKIEMKTGGNYGSGYTDDAAISSDKGTV